MSGWQPIETAPSGPVLLWDGISVTVGSRASVLGTTFIWRAGRAEQVTPFYVEANGCSIWEGDDETGDLVDVYPTHWQPLPEAPK